MDRNFRAFDQRLHRGIPGVVLGADLEARLRKINSKRRHAHAAGTDQVHALGALAEYGRWNAFAHVTGVDAAGRSGGGAGAPDARSSRSRTIVSIEFSWDMRCRFV